MIQFDLIHAPQAWILLLVGIALYIYTRIKRSKTKKLPRPTPITTKAKKDDAEHSRALYYDIEPLKDFDLQNTEPIKIRPFKPKYHLTMALENTTLSDLIAMDNTYPTRIALRKQLLMDHRHDVLAVNPIIQPAVFEFYTWLTSTYLPTRFPTLFTLLSDNNIKNHVTGIILPSSELQTAEQALQTLGENIDCDFLFLLPIPSPHADEGKYRLEGFVTCFPSGFNTARKLGMKLADIHAPVPRYGQKMEKSMDRFFASLPVGKIVKRCNWTVTMTRDLFCLEGSHANSEAEEEEGVVKEEDAGDFDIEQCVLRCERQTLHRLPETGALVFAFKTYQYGLREVREEGSGEEMARAVEGMGLGSVPEITVYKREVVWGEKVKAFLRGEGGA